jgi:predicted site-specific integrase-resolvase
MTRHISAQAVAQLIGIKTATLAKWRREGRGPAGWFHVSTTLVVYPIDEVEQYISKRKRTASGH